MYKKCIKILKNRFDYICPGFNSCPYEKKIGINSLSLERVFTFVLIAFRSTRNKSNDKYVSIFFFIFSFPSIFNSNMQPPLERMVIFIRSFSSLTSNIILYPVIHSLSFITKAKRKRTPTAANISRRRWTIVFAYSSSPLLGHGSDGFSCFSVSLSVNNRLMFVRTFSLSS